MKAFQTQNHGDIKAMCDNYIDGQRRVTNSKRIRQQDIRFIRRATGVQRHINS